MSSLRDERAAHPLAAIPARGAEPGNSLAACGRGNSAAVASNQIAVHRDLVEVVRRHARVPYCRPVCGRSQAQFERLDELVRGHGGRVILDSGCGNGESARALAHTYPDRLVVAIDKSQARIAKARAGEARGNLVIARADCVDIWRLAHAARWPVERHLLLYPNPWPKAKHLRRRWHGHPVFTTLVALGGRIEVRSNWEIYVAEFALALATLGTGRAEVRQLRPDQPLGAFERKYLASGQPLYQVSAALHYMRDV